MPNTAQCQHLYDQGRFVEFAGCVQNIVAREEAERDAALDLNTWNVDLNTALHPQPIPQPQDVAPSVPFANSNAMFMDQGEELPPPVTNMPELFQPSFAPRPPFVKEQPIPEGSSIGLGACEHFGRGTPEWTACMNKATHRQQSILGEEYSGPGIGLGEGRWGWGWTGFQTPWRSPVDHILGLNIPENETLTSEPLNVQKPTGYWGFDSKELPRSPSEPSQLPEQPQLPEPPPKQQYQPEPFTNAGNWGGFSSEDFTQYGIRERLNPYAEDQDTNLTQPWDQVAPGIYTPRNQRQEFIESLKNRIDRTGGVENYARMSEEDRQDFIEVVAGEIGSKDMEGFPAASRDLNLEMKVACNPEHDQYNPEQCQMIRDRIAGDPKYDAWRNQYGVNLNEWDRKENWIKLGLGTSVPLSDKDKYLKKQAETEMNALPKGAKKALEKGTPPKQIASKWSSEEKSKFWNGLMLAAYFMTPVYNKDRSAHLRGGLEMMAKMNKKGAVKKDFTLGKKRYTYIGKNGEVLSVPRVLVEGEGAPTQPPSISDNELFTSSMFYDKYIGSNEGFFFGDFEVNDEQKLLIQSAASRQAQKLEGDYEANLDKIYRAFIIGGQVPKDEFGSETEYNPVPKGEVGIGNYRCKASDVPCMVKALEYFDG